MILALAAALIVAGGPAGEPPPALAQEPKLIRVGLTESAASVTVSASVPYDLVDLAGGRPAGASEPGQGRVLAVTPLGISIDGTLYAGPLAVVPRPVEPTGLPARAGEGSFVLVDGARYRGQLEIRRNGGNLLTVINVLPLEDYLLGVVPREMPAGWPPEALKAQAVAARTYALATINANKYPGSGYDIGATENSQVYGGAGAEDPRTTQAVRDTACQVLTYGGEPIRAVFHSTSGGHTENSENVWGWAYPYLRGVPDFDQASPHYTWRKVLTLAEMTRLAAGKGYNLGSLYRIEPAGPSGVSGRWTVLALVGSAGRQELKAGDFRTTFDLKSTLFEMVPREERVDSVTRSYQGGETVFIRGAGGYVTSRPLTGTAVAVGRQLLPASIEFSGRGWGHGLGLSQWGARGLAEQGNNYIQILQYYYQRTTLETR